MPNDEAVVTPWEVAGKIDYDRLVKEFGTQKIDSHLRGRLEKAAGETHLMLSREIYYSHRDLDVVLKDYESKKGFFLYTGRGPSNAMHIGHLMPFMLTQWLQKKFDVNLYIEITDDEKFLFSESKTQEMIDNQAKADILDISAMGFDPDKTFIFRDTEYIRNLYPLVLKIAKKINFSTVKAVFGFDNTTNIGSSFYPALQIVPTMFERRRCLIPAAIDQDPYWRIQRDIAESLGYLKAAEIHSKLLPPLTGTAGKMSSSQPESAIYLSDNPKVVKQKIMKYAFSGGKDTVEEHRKHGGNPDVDVSFQWLKFMFEPDDKKLKDIEEDYRSGKLLTGELKQILVDKINAFLEKHSDAKEKAKDKVDQFMRTGGLAQRMWETTY